MTIKINFTVLVIVLALLAFIGLFLGVEMLAHAAEKFVVQYNQSQQ